MKRSIRLTVAALSWVCLLSAGSIHGQTPEPSNPGPEQKQLEVAGGEWKYSGTAKETPMGPAYKFAGKETSRMILKGFFLENKWEDKGQSGGKEIAIEGVDLRWYDSTTKTYLIKFLENDGSVTSGSTTINGNTWTDLGTRTDAEGKIYKTKVSSTFSSDRKTRTAFAELSADDGKTWMPWWELTSRKVGK